MNDAEVTRLPEPWMVLPETLEADLVVLPREIAPDGRGLYDDSVVTIVKDLRLLGVSASYQHDQDHRAWIGEQGHAQLVYDLIVGVAGNAGWWALCRLFAVERKSDKLRVKVARCTQEPDGKTTWEWYEMKGTGAAVAEAMAQIEAPRAPDGDDEEEQKALEG